MCDDVQEICWICLENGTKDDEVDLVQPCKCPRRVHKRCLARWQLHSAGKSEEKLCRFCHERLPDWKAAITPQGLEPVQPVMSVHYGGQVYQLRVQPGPEGLKQFQAALHQLLGISPSDHSIDVTFECKVPGNSGKIELQGMTAFDAAVYCASLTAAERRQAKEARGVGNYSSRSLPRSGPSGRTAPPLAATRSSSSSTWRPSTQTMDQPLTPTAGSTMLPHSSSSIRRQGWFGGISASSASTPSSRRGASDMAPRPQSPPIGTHSPTRASRAGDCRPVSAVSPTAGDNGFLIARIPKFLRKLTWSRSSSASWSGASSTASN